MVSPYSTGSSSVPKGGSPTREAAEGAAMQLAECDGPREVMSPRITDAAHGTEDELIRAKTVTVANGPGFQVRQAAEVIMNESTARAIQELLSPQRDTSMLRTDLELLGTEFVRVTNLIGGAVNDLSQSAQA